MQILVVEDESSIREVEVAYLKQSGYSVLEAEDGKQALQLMKDNSIDLVLLDLNLPKLDGIQVCKDIRQKSNVPIIMVTARVEEMDELIGLETGADDYIKKPFSPSILVARVRSMLKRIGKNVIELSGLTIDPEKMLVFKSSEKIVLTTIQFNILYTLASNPGKVFSRDEILDRAYDDTFPPDILDRTVDAHIKTIRKRIEVDTSNPKYILTVIGKGYKFTEE